MSFSVNEEINWINIRFYIIKIKERKLEQNRPNRCVESNRYHKRPTCNRQTETENNMKTTLSVFHNI